MMISSSFADETLILGEHKSCSSGQGEIIGEVTLDPKLMPNKIFDQGSSGTCHGHSALFLSEFMLKFYEPNFNESIARTDFIGASCNKDLYRADQGGLAYVDLYHIRKSRLRVGTDLPIDPLIMLGYEFGEIQPEDSEQLKSFQMSLKNILPDLQKSMPDHAIQETIQVALSKKKYKFLYELNKTLSDLRKRETPLFNIEVFEPDTQQSYEKQTQSIMEYVSANFEFPRFKTPFPINLNYFTEFDFINKEPMNIPHAVTITGKRTFCCTQNKEKRCETQWQIANSQLKNFEQLEWFKAEPLAQTITASDMHLTRILPCSTEKTHATLPACQQEIQGTWPFLYQLMVGDEKAYTLLHSMKDPLTYRFRGNHLLNYALEKNDTRLIDSLLNHPAFQPAWLTTADSKDWTPLDHVVSSRGPYLEKFLLFNPELDKLKLNNDFFGLFLSRKCNTNLLDLLLKNPTFRIDFFNEALKSWSQALRSCSAENLDKLKKLGVKEER